MTAIVVTGRGGVGKSTFAALLVRKLVEKNEGKILAIDADPDMSLGEMLGVDFTEDGRQTVSDLLFDIKKNRLPDNMKTLAFSDKVEFLFHDSVFEGKDFDMIALGVKWDTGCYCSANNALKAIINSMLRSYDYVVVDSPGGLEHLNRKLFNSVDAVFHLVDASRKARRNIERARKILAEVGVTFKHLFLVANMRVPEVVEQELQAVERAVYLGKIPEDDALLAANMEGASLLDMPHDSPAMQAVAEILEKATL